MPGYLCWFLLTILDLCRSLSPLVKKVFFRKEKVNGILETEYLLKMFS